MACDGHSYFSALGRLLVRHPFSLLLSGALALTVVLWVRGGRHYDSVEWMTPEMIVTAYSEMRVLMITATLHDDSSWDMFHNSDIATVDAPWAAAFRPRVWLTDGEAGLVVVIAHLAILFLVLAVVAVLLENYCLRRREQKRRADQF